jgi:hypothetical protein
MLTQGEELTHKFIEEHLIPEVARQGPIVSKGMIDDIAAESGIETQVLQDGLDFYVDEFGEAKRNQKGALATETRKRLERDPDNISLILQSALENAKIIGDLKENYDPRFTLTENYNVLMERYKTNDPDMIGWNMPNIPSIADKLGGLSRHECVSVWGGLPSVGKSTLCRNVAKEIAFNNDDAMVLYFSVDDPSSGVIRSWAAAESELDMDQLIRYQALTATEQARWETGFSKLQNRDNLVLFDSKQCASMDDLNWHIDYYRKHYPDRQPILFVDSLNVVGMTDQNMRESIMNTSQTLKRIANKHNIHVAIVANLRKSNKMTNRQKDQGSQPDVDMYYRPHPEEISETIQVWYDAELLVLCHNQFTIQSSTNLKWDYMNSKGYMESMPYLEAYVWKNKTESPWVSDGFSSQLFFALNRYQSSITHAEFTSLPTTGQGLNNLIKAGKDRLENWVSPNEWEAEVGE